MKSRTNDQFFFLQIVIIRKIRTDNKRITTQSQKYLEYSQLQHTFSLSAAILWDRNIRINTLHNVFKEIKMNHTIFLCFLLPRNLYFPSPCWLPSYYALVLYRPHTSLKRRNFTPCHTSTDTFIGFVGDILSLSNMRWFGHWRRESLSWLESELMENQKVLITRFFQQAICYLY